MLLHAHLLTFPALHSHRPARIPRGFGGSSPSSLPSPCLAVSQPRRYSSPSPRTFPEPCPSHPSPASPHRVILRPCPRRPILIFFLGFAIIYHTATSLPPQRRMLPQLRLTASFPLVSRLRPSLLPCACHHHSPFAAPCTSVNLCSSFSIAAAALVLPSRKRCPSI